MPTTKILQRDSKVLRQKAKEVPVKTIPTKKIQSLIARMHRVLNKQNDGVALAAPQIGEGLRIFVVSGKIIGMKQGKVGLPNMVFINPEIVKLSKKKQSMEEGCLSVRWLYGKVKRSEKATIKAYNEEGVLKTIGASGLLAQAFQHEIDHLNGILFTDKATNLEELPPQKDAK